MNTDRAPIAQIIDTLKGARGHQRGITSDRKLANATHMDHNRLSRIRLGKQPATVDDLEALAAAFDVPVWIFLMPYNEVLRTLTEQESGQSGWLLPTADVRS